LLPDENEDQVAAFIAANPTFLVKPPSDVMAAAGVGSGLADAALGVSNGIVLSPRRTGTDGFFVAVMERKQ
jgi:16S rRNA (cytosine967-C5)-methyltransferase